MRLLRRISSAVPAILITEGCERLPVELNQMLDDPDQGPKLLTEVIQNRATDPIDR